MLEEGIRRRDALFERRNGRYDEGEFVVASKAAPARTRLVNTTTMSDWGCSFLFFQLLQIEQTSSHYIIQRVAFFQVTQYEVVASRSYELQTTLFALKIYSSFFKG